MAPKAVWKRHHLANLSCILLAPIRCAAPVGRKGQADSLMITVMMTLMLVIVMMLMLVIVMMILILVGTPCSVGKNVQTIRLNDVGSQR